MSEINSSAVGITEEMIAAGVRALMEPSEEIYSVRALNLLAAETVVKQVLGAALAGRTVIQLPEPEHVDIDDSSSRPHARWDVDSYVVTAVAMAVGPRVNVRGGPLLFAEEAETRGAALIAAARTARRLASGSSKGGDPYPRFYRWRESHFYRVDGPDRVLFRTSPSNEWSQSGVQSEADLLSSKTATFVRCTEGGDPT